MNEAKVGFCAHCGGLLLLRKGLCFNCGLEQQERLVIFLDVDGVLNSRVHDKSRSLLLGSPIQPEERKLLEQVVAARPDLGSVEEIAEKTWLNDIRDIDSTAVLKLNKIVEATQADVVFSSSWRMTMTLNHFSLLLRVLGYKYTVVDTTPFEAKVYKPREVEIEEWLERNFCRGFVILDDIPMPDRWKDFSISVDGKIGLSYEDVDNAIRILLNQRNK